MSPNFGSADERDAVMPEPSFGLVSHEAEAVSEDLVGQIATNCLQPQSFSAGFMNRNGLTLLQSLLSDPITRVSWVDKKSDGHSLLDELPPEMLPAMPRREVATKLVDTYFEHCDFFSPIFSSKSDFLGMIEPLYSDAAASDPSLVNVRFRALAVFGTSILLLNRVDSSVPAARSESYFTAATQIFSQNPKLTCTGDLEHLTNLLFIIQYCCFASNITAAWHFIGLATRLSIELNLHKERAVVSSTDQNWTNGRRWLFWSLYTFERNLCTVVGRPFSLPDEAIETPLPTSDPDDPERTLAVHLLKCRRMESELYTTLYQKRPANGALLDMCTWREDFRRRLFELHAELPPSQQTTHLAPLNIFSGYLYNNLVILYYPSHHFPDPSNDDLATLAQSASRAIDCYKRSFRAGELRFYWRTVHNLFRSGVAIVYCAQNAVMPRIPGLSREDVVPSINACSSILWGMVERYPLGQAYRDIFENLAESVLNQKDDQTDSMNSQLDFDPGAEHSSIYAELVAGLESTEVPSMALDALSWGFGDHS